MTKRIKRTADFEWVLQIKNDQFIPAPRETQRNWLLNRAIKEAADELQHLHELSKTFVPGTDGSSGLEDRTQRALADHEIMEDWQIPVMEAMAREVTKAPGDVLEIGFGRGIGSDFIQAGGVEKHTIIECNETVIERFDSWRTQYADRAIEMVPGMWQDVIGDLGLFDGIFFHTYPLNENEFIEQVVQSSTFAEHFFSVAARHLKPGGVFTYLTNESDSLSRPHQRALLQEFDSFSLSRVDGLKVPEDTKDAMWADSMIVVGARK